MEEFETSPGQPLGNPWPSRHKFPTRLCYDLPSNFTSPDWKVAFVTTFQLHPKYYYLVAQKQYYFFFDLFFPETVHNIQR